MFEYNYCGKNDHIAIYFVKKNHDMKLTPNALSQLFKKDHDSNMNYLHSTDSRGHKNIFVPIFKN